MLYAQPNGYAACARRTQGTFITLMHDALAPRRPKPSNVRVDGRRVIVRLDVQVLTHIRVFSTFSEL